MPPLFNTPHHQVYDGEPLLLDADATTAELEAGLLQGRASESAASVNAGALLLGLLKEQYNLEDSYAAAKLQLEEEAEKAAAAAEAGGGAAAAGAAGAGGAVGPDGVALTSAEALAAVAVAAGVTEAPGGGGEKLSRRAKAARDKAVAAIKARRKELEESRIDPQVRGWNVSAGSSVPALLLTCYQLLIISVPHHHPHHHVTPRPPTPPPTTPQIPLLTPSDQARRQAFEDIEARADVSASEPPSCCFFTLTNTHQSCTALAFDPAAKQVAAGFSDSSVRLFNLHALGGARRQQGKAQQKRADARRAAARRQQAAGGGADWMDVEGDDEPDEEVRGSWVRGIEIVGTRVFRLNRSSSTTAQPTNQP
jgi:hypothetical protein